MIIVFVRWITAMRYGAHGLPLMGSGDWNDGMNRVGHKGSGESVWLAFFLYDMLRSFASTGPAARRQCLRREMPCASSRPAATRLRPTHGMANGTCGRSSMMAVPWVRHKTVNARSTCCRKPGRSSAGRPIRNGRAGTGDRAEASGRSQNRHDPFVRSAI